MIYSFRNILSLSLWAVYCHASFLNRSTSITSSICNCQTPRGIFFSKFYHNSLFVADDGNHQIKIITHGILTRFAGIEIGGEVSGDGGQATCAGILSPFGVWGNDQGVIYISDYMGNTIRAVNKYGFISTIAGTGIEESRRNSVQATAAHVSHPRLIAGDRNNNIFFTEQHRCTVRKVSSDGILTTIANLAGVCGSSRDGGAASAAQLTSPYGVFADSVGKVYVTELHSIRLIDCDGMMHIYAGVVNQVYNLRNNRIMQSQADQSNVAAATSINLFAPKGIWGNAVGDIYLADQYGVRLVTHNEGMVTSIVTIAESTNNMDSTLTSLLSDFTGVSGDSSDTLFVSNSASNCVLNITLGVAAVSVGSEADTLAMDSQARSEDSVHTSEFRQLAHFNSLDTPSTTPTEPPYTMYTVSGNGVQGSAADGAVASSSSLNQPYGMWVNPAGTTMFLADEGNRRIRKINLLSGITNVFAGNGNLGSNGNNGQATSAQFSYLHGLHVSTSGVVFVADNLDNRVKRIATNGIMTFYAGTGGTSVDPTAANGDNGPASSATFKYPHMISMDTSNNLYIVDYYGYKIRKVNTVTNIITTMAGTGVVAVSSSSYGEGGPATMAQFNQPQGVFADSAGNVYVTDFGGNRIQRIDTAGILNRFAEVNSPNGIWGNSVGDIFIAHNSFLRVVRAAASNMINTIAGYSGPELEYRSSGDALTISLKSVMGLGGDESGKIYAAVSSTDFMGSVVRGLFVSTQSPTVTPTLSMQPTIVQLYYD